MKLISSRDNAWPTYRKMMYMTTWPIYELVIVTRYVSCYMYPETTLSLNKKEKLHGSWFPYWLITTYDVILPKTIMYFLDDADLHRTFCHTLNLKLLFALFIYTSTLFIIRCTKEAQIFGVFVKGENMNFTIHWIQSISPSRREIGSKIHYFWRPTFFGTTEAYLHKTLKGMFYK